MASIKMSTADKKREMQWMAESDLDALKRAKEIMADKARLAAAQAIAKKQMMALGGIVTAGKSTAKSNKK
jgi:hypothetical protein